MRYFFRSIEPLRYDHEMLNLICFLFGNSVVYYRKFSAFSIRIKGFVSHFWHFLFSYDLINYSKIPFKTLFSNRRARLICLWSWKSSYFSWQNFGIFRVVKRLINHLQIYATPHISLALDPSILRNLTFQYVVEFRGVSGYVENRLCYVTHCFTKIQK